MKKRKWIKNKLAAALFVVLIMCVCYTAAKLPMQELKITAMTNAESFGITGSTDIYCLAPSEAGAFRKAQIKFMAVPDTSGKLFTSSGTGQYVYYGCTPMHAECDFLSLGKFMKIRLTLYINQGDLKLYDGTPFDMTKYSLKPVFSIE